MTGIVDAWMQQPTLRFLNHDMLDSLRRWVGVSVFENEISLEATIQTMDAGGVEVGLSAAWYGPAGDLINNDEVAAQVAAYPDRIRGVAGADLTRPMEAVRELRRRAAEGFVGLRIVPWLWGMPPTDRLYYPLYARVCRRGNSILHPGRPHWTAPSI